MRRVFMSGQVRAACLVALAAWSSTARGLEPLPAEAAAVAAVQARGGDVAYDAAGHVAKIDLANRPASDADLRLIAALPKLRTLEAWGAEITDRGIEALASSPVLEQLVLENTDITDVGAKSLAKLGALRVLNLRRSSNLTDAALESVAAITGLEQLVLLYNNFTEL